MHVECYCTIHYVQQNERMEVDSASMFQSWQTFNESTIIFGMEFENMAVYARVNLTKNVKKHLGHASTLIQKKKAYF